MKTPGGFELSRYSYMKTWGYWRTLIVCFCAFSVIGHFFEFIYCFIGLYVFGEAEVSGDVLANPFKPFLVYGVGVVLCAVFLLPLKDLIMSKCKDWRVAFLIFYVISVFIGMGMELGQGFLQNQPVDGVYPLWDVSNYPGNILGQAWIVNDIFIGAIITAAVWAVYPSIRYGLNLLSEGAANVNCAIVVAIFAILIVLTY